MNKKEISSVPYPGDEFSNWYDHGFICRRCPINQIFCSHITFAKCAFTAGQANIQKLFGVYNAEKMEKNYNSGKEILSYCYQCGKKLDTIGSNKIIEMIVLGTPRLFHKECSIKYISFDM